MELINAAYVNMALNLAMIPAALMIWHAIRQNTAQIQLNREAIVANTDAMMRRGRG